MKVPFVDLDAQYQSIQDDIHQAIFGVLKSRKFIHGEYASAFSKHFCEVHGGKYAVGCSNGTSAITVALKVMGIGPGDEVITANNTFIATLEGIHEAGAEIVLVDCKPATYLIDPQEIKAAITKKTKAIIPVHLYGNAVPMDEIVELARTHGLKVMEDAAQAHLATYNGKAVGTFGDFATFSFYPGKNLGAYGDAGLLLTQNEEYFKHAAMFVDHGRVSKYEHQFLAGNDRMDGIQAAVLDVKLKYIRRWTDKRIALAKQYDARFQAKGFKVIEVPKKGSCVYHLYVVEVSNRDAVMEHLRSLGVESGVHYPVPMNMQPALAHLPFKQGDFPHSEKAATRIMSLPIFPEMTKQQQDFVIDEFLKVAQA